MTKETRLAFVAEKMKEFEREIETMRNSTLRTDHLAAQADISKQSAATQGRFDVGQRGYPFLTRLCSRKRDNLWRGDMAQK